MDSRMQNVEQRLQNVDELQETVLGFHEELQNMGRSFRQELQNLTQEMRNITHGNSSRNGHQRNNGDSFKWQLATERRWEEYTELLRKTFGPPYEKPMTELTHLRQTGSLAEFNVRFDTITARLNLSEAYLVDVYVGALKEEIAESVRLFDPRTLLEARRMARVQEISLRWRSNKKMVLPNKNDPQEKFPEPQECIVMQEGCIDGGSSLPSNTEVESMEMEITSGINRSWRFDSAGGVSKSTSPVSSSVSSSIGSASSSPSSIASVLTRKSFEDDGGSGPATLGAISIFVCDFRNLGAWEGAKIISEFNGSSIFKKQTPYESGSWLVIFRMIGFPNFLISSTVQPAATIILSCIGLQLATTFFKWQKYCGSPANSVRPYGHMGLEDGIGEENPTELQLGFTIPLGAINYGSFQKWVSLLNFSPTRILMLEWFKGELITILFGRICSLSRKKKKGNEVQCQVTESFSPTSRSCCQNLKPMCCFQICIFLSYLILGGKDLFGRGVLL